MKSIVWRAATAFALGFVPIACDEDPTPSIPTQPIDQPPTGLLRIRVETSGDDRDRDGYVLSINSQSRGGLIGPVGTAAIRLLTGTYELRLQFVDDNCAIQGQHPRFMTVEPNATLDVTFSVVCTRAGGMIDLGVPDGWKGPRATAVNSKGIVVGNVYREESPEGEAQERAFRWSPTTGMVILPRPGNSVLSVATDINTQGDIVGYVRADPYSVYRPIRWTSNGTVEEIGTARGGFARAINDNGQVAGASDRYDSGNRRDGSLATFWDADGTVINIGDCRSDCDEDAYAINGSGQVVGTIGENAFYWSRAEGLTTLGTGAGSDLSSALISTHAGAK
ncbi:MAG: hypothetical protein H0W30_02120 [Gemmatimonadaceae bacterium]|nr:hypothetical protein [Gemmatimonadaceae bacterium]MBA3557372.1 hypothetical protein [Gemmatimonadaceae bacterium]